VPVELEEENMQKWMEQESTEYYQPGEGYGLNAIPFAGVAPRAKGLHGKKQALALLNRAREKGKELIERRQRRAENPHLVRQTLPIPQAMITKFGQGWLEGLGAELGCQIEISTETWNEFGQEWQDVSVEGNRSMVQEVQTRMMAKMVPPVAARA